jgi:predicted nucleic acid-binding Zn ribbon protein
MIPLQSFATKVLADLIRGQPASQERTAFAWQVAVGPALARSTSVELHGAVLTVRARDPRWAQEVVRASEVILQRLQYLLGDPGVVRIELADYPK